MQLRKTNVTGPGWGLWVCGCVCPPAFLLNLPGGLPGTLGLHTSGSEQVGTTWELQYEPPPGPQVRRASSVQAPGERQQWCPAPPLGQLLPPGRGTIPMKPAPAAPSPALLLQRQAELPLASPCHPGSCQDLYRAARSRQEAQAVGLGAAQAPSAPV